jgi:hypothetical protein
MKTILAAAAIAIAIAEYGGPKGFTSGNQLYNDCSAEAGSLEKGFCVGYVIGASDAHDMLLKHYIPPACIDQKVQVWQVHDVVIRYLIVHPERRTDPAAGLVMEALAEKWRCS